MPPVPPRGVAEGMRHPLALALGPAWRWEYTGGPLVRLRHPSGFSVLIAVRPLADRPWLWLELGEALAAQV